APGIIDVCMEWTDSQPVLHVMDRGPGYSLGKAVLPDDPFAEGQRGLYIVAAVGSDFTVTPMPGRGTHAQVVLPVYRSSTEKAQSRPALL
ncbi:MAG: ATP-binding protein, partial [Candidatus Eremiobacteraeota bacterium]|nr:ATP-binding protein [Candidatus Eremiobacteraeota bacterium]